MLFKFSCCISDISDEFDVFNKVEELISLLSAFSSDKFFGNGIFFLDGGVSSFFFLRIGVLDVAFRRDFSNWKVVSDVSVTLEESEEYLFFTFFFSNLLLFNALFLAAWSSSSLWLIWWGGFPKIAILDNDSGEFVLIVDCVFVCI